MKILTLIILLFCGFQVKSENQDFIEFIKSFDKNRNSIDLEFAQKYLDFESNPDESKIYTDKIIFKNDSLVGFTCFVPCAAGGICERTNYYIFNLSGELLSIIRNFEFNIADCGFNNYNSCIFYSDSLLIFENTKEKTDCNNDSLISKRTKIEYFEITPHAVLKKVKTDYINTKRKYYFASIEFISFEQFNTFPFEELGAIRNEIFAAHGYKFKTEKWQRYFADEEWYKPDFANVDQFLTVIEKQNIETIIKLEKIKNAR